MRKFLADNCMECNMNDGCLTYIQALEQIDQKNGPMSVRERNLLNVFARLPVAQPLRSTVMIMDISQAVDRCKPKTDGSVPTMATNAKMWSIRARKALSCIEMAKLLGHDRMSNAQSAGKEHARGDSRLRTDWALGSYR